VRRVHSVHMAKVKWQEVLAAKDSGDSPAVRRLSVPGGWLYQVEHFVRVDDLDEIARIEWFPPVFVPFHGDGQ
jgi:hypothetical protein